MDWTRGRSASWHAVSQPLRCPYLLCVLVLDLWCCGCLPLDPLELPLLLKYVSVVGCGGGPYEYGGLGIGIGGGKVGAGGGWSGWYLWYGCQGLVFCLDLPLPLVFLPFPLSLLVFLRTGCARMSAKVMGSWRMSSVVCLKEMLLRIFIAMSHEKVSQASLTFGSLWGFLRVNWMNRSM